MNFQMPILLPVKARLLIALLSPVVVVSGCADLAKDLETVSDSSSAERSAASGDAGRADAAQIAPRYTVKVVETAVEGLPAGIAAADLEIVTARGVFDADRPLTASPPDRPLLAQLRERRSHRVLRSALWLPAAAVIDFGPSGNGMALIALQPIMANVVPPQRAELVAATAGTPEFAVLRDTLAMNAAALEKSDLAIAPDDLDAYPQLSAIAQKAVSSGLVALGAATPMSAALPNEAPTCKTKPQNANAAIAWCDGGESGLAIINNTTIYYAATVFTAAGKVHQLIDAKAALVDVKFEVSKNNLAEPWKWVSLEKAASSVLGVSPCSSVSLTRGFRPVNCGNLPLLDCFTDTNTPQALASWANLAKILTLTLDLVGVLNEAPDADKVAKALSKLNAVFAKVQKAREKLKESKKLWSFLYIGLQVIAESAAELQLQYDEPELAAKAASAAELALQLAKGVKAAALAVGIDESELAIAAVAVFSPATAKQIGANKSLIKARLAGYLCNFAGGKAGKYGCGKITQFAGDVPHLAQLIAKETLRDALENVPLAALTDEHAAAFSTAILLFKLVDDVKAKDGVGMVRDIVNILEDNAPEFGALAIEIAGGALSGAAEVVAKSLLAKLAGGWLTVGMTAVEIANKAAPFAYDFATAEDAEFCMDVGCNGPPCAPPGTCLGGDGPVCGADLGKGAGELYGCKAGVVALTGQCANGCQGPPGSAACKPATNCGNGACDSGENQANCPKDCKASAVCNNGTCEPTENSSNCPQDCSASKTCGDGICQDGESCPEDCQKSPVCGNGNCEAGESPNCADCKPAGFCGGKIDGPWCADLDTLVGCKGGKQVTATQCKFGCESKPPGTADACRTSCPGAGDWGVIRLAGTPDLWAVEKFDAATTTAHRIHSLSSYQAIGAPKFTDVSKTSFSNCYSEQRSIDGSDNPLLKILGDKTGAVWMFSKGTLRSFDSPGAYCACSGIGCSASSVNWKPVFEHATQALIDQLNPCQPPKSSKCLWCNPGSPVNCDNGVASVCSAVCEPESCDCKPQASQKCDGNSLVWADSCGNKGAKIKDCPGGCSGSTCYECQPNCAGKQCGNNGCGGSCGTCPSGTACAGSSCQCTPNANQICVGGAAMYWQDGCENIGNLANNCPFGCNAGGCKTCQPMCAGKDCGDDGCGGVCGTCKGGSVCQSGKCACQKNIGKGCFGANVAWFDSCGQWGDVAEPCKFGCQDAKCKPAPACAPNCVGKTCGPDGCGGGCGTCAAGMVCGAAGICACAGSCDDGNTCTDDNCTPIAGCVHASNASACSDGNACTASDACAGGLCSGTLVDCNDNNPCTTDTCDSIKGCAHVANMATCSDGNACTIGDSCSNASCAAGSPKACNDGDPCTIDTCDPKSGACSSSQIAGCGGNCTTASQCADNNPCTDDKCVAGKCAFVANSVGCNDGNACTAADACAGGVCGGAPISCDDGNVCTVDACDAAKGCINSANTPPCSDGNACTIGDICTVGKCASGPAVNCNDNNPCTSDSCDAIKGCVNSTNTLPCTDGNACTAGDACAGGKCGGGSAVNCDDGNLCTADSCQPISGCVHAATKVACSNCACPICVPSCIGKTCGADGCGGSCGNCAAGKVCNAAQACETSWPAELDCGGSWPDNCNPFLVTIPANTGAKQLEFWAVSDKNPYIVPLAAEGGVFLSPHKQGFVACAVTVTWPEQWSAWQAASFPGPTAPAGTATVCTAKKTVPFCELPLGAGAYGAAHDGNCVASPFATLQVTAPSPATINAWLPGSPNGVKLASPLAMKLSKSQACSGTIEIAVQESGGQGGWYGCDPWMPALAAVAISVNGKVVAPDFVQHPWACGGKAPGNVLLGPAKMGCVF